MDNINVCNKIIKKIYDNLGDINKEIENNNNFKEILEDFLDSHPLIKYSQFKHKANKLDY